MLRKVATLLLVALLAVPATAIAQSVLREDQAAPGELDPAKANDYAGSILMFNIYDTLVMPDPQHVVQPHLAASWTASPDGKTFTFHLRHGVKFHDGSELTAADVVFSYQRTKAINQGFAYLFTGWVADVKAIDPYTVEFDLSSAYAPFLATLVRLPIVNKALVMKHLQPGKFGAMEDYGQAWLTTHDAGSGAYEVVSHDPQQLTVMKQFPQYFLGFNAKAPETVRQSYSLDPATMRTLMVRKEHEISSQWAPTEVYRALAKQPGIKLLTEGGQGTFLLKMNTQRAPTDDVHFRKAMALAFDYKALLSTLQITDTVSAGKASNGPLPAGVFGYDSSIPFPHQDLAAAKAELAKSKYAGDLSAHPVDMAWVAEVPSEEKMALLFQQNMSELGITVNITKVPWATLTSRFTKVDTTPNIYPLSTGLNYPDPDGLLYVMYDSQSRGSFWSSSWLSDPTTDQLLSEARTTLDTSKRLSLYHQAEQRIVALQPDIYLYDQLAIFAAQDYVTLPELETPGMSVPVVGANWRFRLASINK